MGSDWQRIAIAKREAIFQSIPIEWRLEKVPTAEEQKDVTGAYIHKLLTPTEVAITESDLVQIAEKTTTGAWKAIDVTTAFAHRAALAHQLTGCLLEIFFDMGFARAKELDEYFAKHNKPVGPLHGVPVSLKDQFHIKGVETSMGYVGWIGTFEGEKHTTKEKNFESELTKELLQLGAVLYCKSTVPHTLMAGETNNNILGYCLNPKNRHLSAGGSSGGEGALIGLRGSPVGFGTDIGGSIRAPSGFNGLWGLKPSGGRFPYEGAANSLDGQNSLLSVVGPMATTPGALRYISRAIMSTEPWLHDPLVLELPWRDEHEQLVKRNIAEQGKFTFGIMYDDGQVRPQPPVRRAIQMVKNAMTELGHEVIEWKPPKHASLFELAITIWTYDGGADVRKHLGLAEEPQIPQINGLYGKAAEEKNASFIAATNVQKRQIQKEYMEYWNSTINLTSTGRPVDAVLSPITPFPAALPGTSKNDGYCSPLNILDYTAVVMPVTNVDKLVDKADTDFQAVNELDQFYHDIYDPDVYDGAHVSVQLFGRRLQEEKVVALAEHIASALPSN